MKGRVLISVLEREEQEDEKMTDFGPTSQTQTTQQTRPAKTPGKSAREIRRKYEKLEELKISGR